MDKKNKNKKKLFNSRTMRFGSYAVLITVIVVALVVILNAILGYGKIRENLKLDLTHNKLFTIGDITKDVLKELDKPVEIYGLFDEDQVTQQYAQVVEFLNQYKKSSEYITVKYVDTDKDTAFITNVLDPDMTKGIQKGDFAVKSGNKVKILSGYDIFETEMDQYYGTTYTTGSNAEQAFTGAIKFVTAEFTPVVYFTKDHGERAVENEYTTLKIYLERNNYEVKTLSLATAEAIPEDAEIIVFASPQQDMTTRERELVDEYLRYNGGKGIFLFDSPTSNVKLNEFERLLAEFSVSLNYDIVEERNDQKHAPNKPYDLIPVIQDTDINSVLSPDQFIMVMPKSRSINILLNDKEWVTPQSLMKTSKDAVGKPIMEGATAIDGPLDLAVSVDYTGSKEPSKILVMGNGYFMTDKGMNEYQYSVNGMRFFLNSLNWMQDKQEELNIPAKSLQDIPGLTLTQMTVKVIQILTWLVLPLIILGVGLFIWMGRRHL